MFKLVVVTVEVKGLFQNLTALTETSVKGHFVVRTPLRRANANQAYKWMVKTTLHNQT